MITRPLGQNEDWQALDTGQRLDIDDMVEQAILYRLEQERKWNRQEIPARNTLKPCEPR